MLGRKIRAYEVVDTLGSGSWGVVYRARNLNLDRDAALKILPDAITQNPEVFEPVWREIRKALRLDHPNICPIYELFREDNQYFIVMELLEGQTLQDLLAEFAPLVPLDVAQAPPPLVFARYFEYVRRILDAIEYAHGQGHIHKGLKPANIFITHRDVIKVMDFGLAGLSAFIPSNREMSSGTAFPGVTNHGTRLKAEPHRSAGWAAYMSPEQVRGEKLDERSDLFSLGAVFYEMATGRPPFAGESSDAAMAAVVDHSPRHLGEMIYELPPELDRIMGKALEKDVGARYQRAVDFRSDIERLLRDTDSWRRGPIVR